VLKLLPAHDLTFEAWIYHPQIKTLTELARECPEVKTRHRNGDDRKEERCNPTALRMV
jgi:hypothetical protein